MFSLFIRALATSAAPRYFKPFHHKATGQLFQDGAINYNNPVAVADRERQLLWPPDKHEHPDILLSIGTGHVSQSQRHTRAGSTSTSPIEGSITSIESGPPQPDAQRSSQGGFLDYFRRLQVIVRHQTRQQLDTHRMWQEFKASKMSSAGRAGQGTANSQYMNDKYRRLDIPIPFEEFPKLNDVNTMGALEDKAAEYCKSEDTTKTLGQIAAQLVASLFYFQLLHVRNVHDIKERSDTPNGEAAWKLKSRFELQGF